MNQYGRSTMPDTAVRIGNRPVADCEPCYVIAEIGINHNGDIDLAKRLISVAVAAGCDAVKFQKRTVDVVYSAEELAKPRESPFGTTNGDLKRGLELDYYEYQEIDAYCRASKIAWFASCWDEKSVDFIDRFHPPCYKIASASLTDDHLLRHTRATGKPIIVSTGMSTIDQIDHAVDVLGKENLILLHASSTYPAYYERAEPARDSDHARAVRRSRRVLRPRDRYPVDHRRRGAGRLLRRAPHHDGPLDGGVGSCGVARTERHFARGPGHPADRAVHGRRHQARLRARTADHQEVASGRRACTEMKHLKAIVLDVDGVLTDGGVWWGPNGEEWKRFCFADIMGVSLAMKSGLIVALISGEDSPLVDRFAVKMGITDIEKNCKDKARALRAFAERRGLALSEVTLHG